VILARRVAAGKDPGGGGGEGESVTGLPAQGVGDGAVGDPAGGVDAAHAVDHVLRRDRRRRRAGQRQRTGKPCTLCG
jgi:hypothetical protein